MQTILVLSAPGSLFVACQAVSTLLGLTESSEILHLLPVERVKNSACSVVLRDFPSYGKELTCLIRRSMLMPFCELSVLLH